MFRTGPPRPHSQLAPFTTYVPTLAQNQRTMHAQMPRGGRLRITPANLLTTPLYSKTILPHYPNHCQGKIRQNSHVTQNNVVGTCTCIMGCGKGMYRLKPHRPPFSRENGVLGWFLPLIRGFLPPHARSLKASLPRRKCGYRLSSRRKSSLWQGRSQRQNTDHPSRQSVPFGSSSPS